MTNFTAERLHEILVLFIQNDENEFDSETIYGTLADECRCSDEEIKALGFERLIPLPADQLRIKVDRILYGDLLHDIDESDIDAVEKVMAKLREILKASMVKLYTTAFCAKVKSAYAEFCRFCNDRADGKDTHLDLPKIRHLLTEAIDSLASDADE